MAIINCRQAREMKFQAETNNKPSLAVPNQTLSIEEILRRFTNGGTVIQHEGTYSDTFIPEGIHKLDPVDMDMLNEQFSQQRKDLTDIVIDFDKKKSEQNEEKQRKKDEKYREDIAAAAAELLKSGAK